MIVRFVLGIAEAANFPASIKAVGMWFPQKERAFATGIFNSGTSVGVIVSVAHRRGLPAHWGWQMALRVHRRHGSAVADLLAEVLRHAREAGARRHSPSSSTSRPGLPPATQSREGAVDVLLRYREIWPFIIGKFITDPVWWFYLFWLPSYLERERGQNPLTSAASGSA